MSLSLSRYFSTTGNPTTVGELEITAIYAGEVETCDYPPNEPPDYVWSNCASVEVSFAGEVYYLDNITVGWWRHELTGSPTIDFSSVDSEWRNVDGDALDVATVERLEGLAGGAGELYWAIDSALLELCKRAAPSALAILDDAREEWAEEHSPSPSSARAS